MSSLSSLNFRLSANIAPFKKGLGKAERAMDRFGRKMQQTGKNLSMRMTAPLAALGAVSFNVFKNFEFEMSKVKAVSGATADEFAALEKNAKDLGASTMFSASQVAGLQTEFAKLGFSATEINKVTESTLNLAQASGADLAHAAEVAGSTLRAFGLDASETGRVTDVMASSFSSSALDINLFADSMKFVAPVAKSAGMSLEQTSAMLAVLANNGIKGSQAGTALRRIISEIGATGKPVSEALKQLAQEGLNLADAKDEVGRSAQSALLVLAEGVDQIAPLTTEFENSAGAAKEMADIMGNTAFGAGQRLKSALEGLAISIGEIVSVAVVPLVEFLARAASALNNMSDGAKRAVVIVAALAASIGPVVFILGSFTRALAAIRSATLLTTVATSAFGVAVQIATSPITLIIAAVAALAAGLVYLGYNFETLKAIAINSMAKLFNTIIPFINKLILKFNAIAGLLGMDALMVTPFQNMEKVAVPAFKSIGQVVTEIKDDLGLLKEETKETTEATNDFSASMEKAAASTEKAVSATKRMSESLVDIDAKGFQILKPQIAPVFQSMRKGFVDTTTLAIQAGNAVKDVFASSIRSAFGELEKGETRFGKFKESMLQMLKDLIIQFIAAAIAAFALAVAVRMALGGIGGVGSIADIFSTMQSVGGFMPNIPMLAQGGIVTSPTLAMIGEGGESEAVIPLSKLDSMMGGGRQNVIVHGRISGQDILLSSEKATRTRSRYRGF